MRPDLLACPRTGEPLRLAGERLVSAGGRAYPVVSGTPVLLLDDAVQTIGIAERSLAYAHGQLQDTDGYYLESLGVSDQERALAASLVGKGPVDPAVSVLVGATNGIAYKRLIGRLETYPVPEIPLPQAPPGRPLLLDIGCSWGRWSLAAARKGYLPVGLDPSLAAVRAAGRVAASLGLAAEFVVGDGRHLPFRDASFDTVFSYSVLQHMSPEDVASVLAEAGRVLMPGGTCLVQMPNRWGLRCLYHQARRGFRRPVGFEVRYWSLGRLKSLFTETIGPAEVSIDCFFGLGLQKSDAPLYPPLTKAAAGVSALLASAGPRLPWLAAFADSVYVRAVKPR